MSNSSKKPIFVFYKPRVASYRGWMLLIQGIWVLWVNIFCIIWGLIHLIGLILLWVFWTVPRNLIRIARNKHHATSVRKAREQLKYHG